MAITNIFFPSWVGNDNTLRFTVVDDAGVAVDISSASEIYWRMAVDEFSPILLDKTKTAGWITFPNLGTDGVFDVALSGVDTASLDHGTYYQESKVVLSSQETHTGIGTLWLRPAL